MAVENLKLKPTLKEPTETGIKTQNNFRKEIIKRDLNPDIIKETDVLLKEDEVSLKRKIFKLDKMEALVFGDPKLTAVYDKLSVDGRDKYGYHWNETLMNIIFNDYILNSPKYLQRYKMAIPKKKKRRDDSGINQLKKSIRKDKGLPTEDDKPAEKNEGWDIERDGINRTEKKFDTMENTGEDNLQNKIEETTSSASSGQYSTPAAWSKNGKPAMKAPAWKGGLVLENAIKDGAYLTNSNVFEEFIKELNEDADPCWDDYEMVGTKEKGGKEVPNCVPEGTNEGLDSPNNDSKVPMAEALFGNASATNSKLSGFLSQNKDQFKRLKSLPQGMENNILLDMFIKQYGKVDFSQMANNIEQYGQAVLPMLAHYSIIVERGLRNDPKVARKIKEMNMIIDPKFLQTMGESVNMTENHLSTKEDKIKFIIQNKQKVFQGNVSPTVLQDLSAMSDVEIDALYQSAESGTGVSESNEVSVDENIKGLKLNGVLDLGTKLTYAKSAQEIKNAFSEFMSLNDITEEDLLDSVKMLRSNARMMASSGSQASENEALINEIIYFLTKETDWKEQIGETNMNNKPTGFNNPIKSKVETKPVKTGDSTKQWAKPVQESIIDAQSPSMVSGNPTSMIKEPQTPTETPSSSMSSIGGIGESLEESINKELNFYKKHLNKLNKMVNEERRHPALVNLDRLKNDNNKNFKSDLKNSNLDDSISLEDQLTTDELTQEVGDNPYKLAQDIEKKSLAKTKGEAFKNVGDSANEAGDEIPKRNFTKDEMLGVAMNRGKGMQDIVYDNEPSDKFENRMKADLGDDIYKLRQQKMEFQSHQPMYNKDTQPTHGGSKPDENNKYKKGFNNESISGKYTDEFGNKRFVDFKLNETIEIAKTDKTYLKVSTDGMGNTYTSKIQENHSYTDFTTAYDLFLKEGKIYRVKKHNLLNEGVENKVQKTENMDKMKHLMGYKPSDFMKHKKIK